MLLIIINGTGASGADIYIMEISIMNREELFQNIEEMTVGLDDTFKFHCTQCGKCCTYREDIILSPRDIFKMAKELKMGTVEFFHTYCRSHIGDVSRFPIIRLNSVGSDARCPLLKNNLCSVHNVKPAVCAMFPLGRYVAMDAQKDPQERLKDMTVKYLLQPPECGDESETHTVREWLTGFDIATEDEFFIKWNCALQDLGELLKQHEKKQDMMTMVEIWAMTRVVIYLMYDTAKPFLPQFEANVQGMVDLLNNVKKLKAILNKAREGAAKKKGAFHGPFAM